MTINTVSLGVGNFFTIIISNPNISKITMLCGESPSIDDHTGTNLPGFRRHQFIILSNLIRNKTEGHHNRCNSHYLNIVFEFSHFRLSSYMLSAQLN